MSHRTSAIEIGRAHRSWGNALGTAGLASCGALLLAATQAHAAACGSGTTTYANPSLPATDPTLRATFVAALSGVFNGASMATTEYCTAELLADTAQDRDPLVVMAQHCLPDGVVPGDTLPLPTYWEVENYNGATGTYGFNPASTQPVNTYVPQRTYQATVRAIVRDAVLLDLNAAPPTDARFSAWTASDPPVGDTLTNTNDTAIQQLQLAAGTWTGQQVTVTERNGTYPEDQIAITSGAPGPGSSGSGWYDATGALRAITSGGSDQCTVDVIALADAFRGDGTPTGSFSFWLDPSSSGQAAAAGQDAPTNNTLPDGAVANPPPTAGPTASAGGGAAFGVIEVMLPFLVLSMVLRRTSTRRRKSA